MNKITLLAITLLFSLGCGSKVKDKKRESANTNTETTFNKLSDNALQEYKVAYFASGCFWCVEAIYEDIIGVKEVISGYSGGTEKNPTYGQVGSGSTSHAEAVKVYYDPNVVDFKTLVKVFFSSHDPTTLNRQGPDYGTQYRSIAFYSNGEEKKIIEDYIDQLTKDKVYKNPIVTQVKKFEVFYDAEEYHQDYKKLNPNNPYIINISTPRYNRSKAKYPVLLKKKAD
ncbi:MAG: peptide-methionine (S)-S-oxide reductase [Maribacter sp.]|nr:MAG: peptide-methionine (S)-S-oxide reductase [Maribacter sp.]